MVIENLIGGFASDDDEGSESRSTTGKCSKCGKNTLETSFNMVDGELIMDTQSCSNPRCNN